MYISVEYSRLEQALANMSETLAMPKRASKLHVAAAYGLVDKVRNILRKTPYEHPDPEGVLAGPRCIHQLASGYPWAHCRNPKDRRHHQKEDMEEAKICDWTPLHLAARYGHIDVLRVFIEEHDVDPDVLSLRRLSTPIAEAAATGQLKTVEYLLSKGANSRHVDYEGTTPLIRTCNIDDNADVLRLLLRPSKGNIGQREKMFLDMVAPFICVDMLELLLDNCLNVDDIDQECSTLLMRCTRNIDPAQHTALSTSVSSPVYTAQCLLGRGIDINIQDINGYTALHCAARWGTPALVSFLVTQTNINLYQRQNQQETALDLARLRCKTEPNYGAEIYAIILDACATKPEIV